MKLSSWLNEGLQPSQRPSWNQIKKINEERRTSNGYSTNVSESPIGQHYENMIRAGMTSRRNRTAALANVLREDDDNSLSRSPVKCRSRFSHLRMSQKAKNSIPFQ